VEHWLGTQHPRQDLESYFWISLSVMYGQCDPRPGATFTAEEHDALSSPKWPIMCWWGC